MQMTRHSLVQFLLIFVNLLQFVHASHFPAALDRLHDVDILSRASASGTLSKTASLQHPIFAHPFSTHHDGLDASDNDQPYESSSVPSEVTSTPLSLASSESPSFRIPAARPVSKSLTAPTCEALVAPNPAAFIKGSVCYGVIDYPVLNYGLNVCLNVINSKVGSLPTMWALFPEPCRSAVALFTCTMSHPRCDTATQLPVCTNVCTNIASYCGAYATTIYGFLSQTLSMPTDCTSPYFATGTGLPTCNPGTSSQIYVPSAPTTTNTTDTTSGGSTSSSSATSSSNITYIQPVVPKCELYTGSVCASILGPNAHVYIPAGYAQAAIESLVTIRYSFLFNIAPVALGCNTKFAQYICASAFQPCSNLEPFGAGSGISTVLPRPICQGTCQAFDAACAATGLFAKIPQLKPNCSSVGSLVEDVKDCNGTVIQPSSTPDFPTMYADFGGGFLSLCNDYVTDDKGMPLYSNTSSFSPGAIANCPAPLVPSMGPDDPHTIVGGLCSTPCPILIMSDKSYSKADVLVPVISVLSFVLSLFTLVTWLIEPAKRQQHYICFFILFTFFLAFWQVLQLILWRHATSAKHLSSSFCVDPTQIVERIHWSRGAKARFDIVVSFIQIYNIHAIVYWWCLNSIDLFMKVVLNSRVMYPSKQWYVKEIIFCSLGCILPLVAASLCMGYNIAGGSGLAVAFLSVHTSTLPDATKLETILDWPIFYLPVIFCCAIGVVCWAATMVTFVRSSQKTASHAAPAAASSSSSAATAAGKPKKKTTSSRGFSHYARSIIFLAACFSVFAITFAFRSYGEAHVTDWSDSAADYIQCLLVDKPSAIAGSNGLSDTVDCGDRPKKAPNEFIWLLFQAAVTGLGVIGFALYGTMPNNLLIALVVDKLLLLCPKGCRCLERYGSKNRSTNTFHSQMSAPEGSKSHVQDGAGGGNKNTLAVRNAGSRRPSTSAASSRLPALPQARRPSFSNSALSVSHSGGNNNLNGSPRIAPGKLGAGTAGTGGSANPSRSNTPSPSPSRGPSRRGSGAGLPTLPELPITVEMAEIKGKPEDEEKTTTVMMDVKDEKKSQPQQEQAKSSAAPIDASTATVAGGSESTVAASSPSTASTVPERGRRAEKDSQEATAADRSRSRSRSKSKADMRREAAEARIAALEARRLKSPPTDANAAATAAENDDEAMPDSHPGLSIRVSIPKPLPPDSVFAPTNANSPLRATTTDTIAEEDGVGATAAEVDNASSASTAIPTTTEAAPSEVSSSPAAAAAAAPESSSTLMRALKNLGYNADAAAGAAPASPSRNYPEHAHTFASPPVVAGVAASAAADALSTPASPISAVSSTTNSPAAAVTSAVAVNSPSSRRQVRVHLSKGINKKLGFSAETSRP